MTNPVPGRSEGTPYGRRGRHWSCNRNSAGEGVHTGVDFPAPSGTKVVAARGGTVRHTRYGSAFGDMQFAIVCPDGTEDFYAHTNSRPRDGAKVETGQVVATVGSRGNSTGPHLHFERHKVAGRWSCDNHVNPRPSIEYEEDDMPLSKEDIQRIAQAVWRYQMPANAEKPQRAQKMVRETWEKTTGKSVGRSTPDPEDD